jgi:hypothetical protein
VGVELTVDAQQLGRSDRLGESLDVVQPGEQPFSEIPLGQEIMVLLLMGNNIEVALILLQFIDALVLPRQFGDTFLHEFYLLVERGDLSQQLSIFLDIGEHFPGKLLLLRLHEGGKRSAFADGGVLGAAGRHFEFGRVEMRGHITVNYYKSAVGERSTRFRGGSEELRRRGGWRERVGTIGRDVR